jgi:hypothetical protein
MASPTALPGQAGQMTLIKLIFTDTAKKGTVLDDHTHDRYCSKAQLFSGRRSGKV